MKFASSSGHSKATVRIALAVAILVTVAPVWRLSALARERGENDHRRAYPRAIAFLERMITTEIERGTITGISLALVDGADVVWAGGFGFADPRRGRRADADTVYRVGSISKLFTAIGVMSLVDTGKLDLDAPIDRHVPEFRIDRSGFPGAGPTTLRQLMAHRSGFPRESPIGSYFDGSEPTLEETVRSLAGCALVHAPGSTMKYSNIGVSLEGLIAARVAGVPFDRHQRETLLDPLGMTSSDFAASDRVRGRLATGFMRLADGREVPAPLFELGTIPAGNLYASVRDVARFLVFLLAGGRDPAGKAIVEPETLESMFEIQYAAPGQKNGFGLGFWVDRLDGHRWVGHGGAVYGFSSQLVALPDEGLGVIVCASDDVVNGATGMVARRAMQWMLAEREGRDGPTLPETIARSPDEMAPLAGHFRADDSWLTVSVAPHGLRLENMGRESELRATGERRFLAFGGGLHETPLVFSEDRDTIEFAGRSFERFDPLAEVTDPPAAWRDYLGIYGPWFIPTVVEVRHGKLVALVENVFRYVLEPAGEDTFLFRGGLYASEELEFIRSQDGMVRTIRLGTVTFTRQDGR